jgi:hypothetical protein
MAVTDIADLAGIANLAAHLSPAAQRFLEYVAREPGRSRRIDHLACDYPDFLRVYAGKFYPLQSWPTFLGGQKLADLRRATIELTRLITSIPERLFENDPRRIAAYYGIRHEGLVTLLLEPPNNLDGLLVRNDFMDSPAGFQCLEVNAGQIGGWELRYFDPTYRSQPIIAHFLEEEGLRPYHRDPVAMLLQHVVAHNLGKPTAAGGTLNVVIAVARFEAAMEKNRDELNQTYRDVLAAGGSGLVGELRLCTFADLSVRDNQVWLGRERLPVHAVVELSPQQTPEPIFRSFKAGQVSLYNGPINHLAADKRNFALLSENQDSAAFTAGERDFLRECLPWTRLVTAGPVTWHGVTMPLPDLLLARREEFVLKPISGMQGQGVTVGRMASPERWSRQVEKAVAQGQWLAQQRVDSRPYVYQVGDDGSAVHDAVWGAFCFGETYGGGFLRMMPRGTADGVVNAARGAACGILFEV